jgi:3-oxoacyl-[acyl-carrier protein] reductase
MYDRSFCNTSTMAATQNFENKNILIVGASSGIGLELATQLNAAGANLFTASRTYPDELKKLNSTHITLDVTASPLAEALQALPEVLHGLVYCPGTINLKPFNRLTRQDFQHDFEVNVLGAVEVLQASLKQLKKAEGASVVLFSTVAATTGMGFHASVAASKAGIEGLSRSLAAEWAPNHIRVNTIAPSLTDTPLAAQLLSTAEKKEAAGKRHPLGRTGTPADLASAATYLLSGASGWLTGQVLHLDGGMSTLK